MRGIDMFKELSDESDNLIQQIIDLNPIGSLIINDTFDILSINETMKGYFKYDIKQTDNYFGNIFKCQYLQNSNDECGSLKRCGNCKIRNSIASAFEFKRVIKNLQVNKWFIINGEKNIKWFDMTIVPFEIKGKNYMWISLIDLTELMKYKIELELNQVLSDEENNIEKDKFHDNVMECIRTNCYIGDEAYLTLIELKHSQDIQNKFGSLWRDDYISSFYRFLNEQTEANEYICRYSSNQFLVFLPCKEGYDFKKLLECVSEYQYKQFHMIDSVIIKTIKLRMDSANVKEIVAGDQLHIEYFKALTVLEQLEENSVFELLF